MEMEMTSENIGNLIGDFIWDFGQQFFIETAEGNFVWNDPAYNGDGKIHRYHGTMENFFPEPLYGRDKGKHYINDYCGENLVIGEDIYPKK